MKSVTKLFIPSNILSVLLLLLIFSCNGNHQLDSSQKTVIVPPVKCKINWMGHWRNEGEKGQMVRDIANEYEFINQDIEVNLKFSEDVYYKDDLSEVNFIVDQIHKPIPDWDIIRLFGYYQRIGQELKDPNWAENNLVDFSTVPGFLESHKAFISNSIYKKRFNNHYYGPYNECQLVSLFVNTEVAQKMGITVKQFDMTFDDFLGYIKAADNYNKTHPTIIPLFEYDWKKAKLIFKILYFSLMDNPEDILDCKLNSKKLEALEKCYQAFEELSKYHPMEKDYNSHKWSKENGMILHDSCLFFPNFTFMASIWKKNDKALMSKVIPCEFPVFRPSKIYMGGYTSNWAVLKSSPHKAEAIKLLMYWCRPDVAEMWVRNSQSPSGVKGNLTTSDFGTDPYDRYCYMMDKKYGNNLVTDEDNEYMVGDKNKDLDSKINEVLDGTLTAKQAFEQFKAKAKF